MVVAHHAALMIAIMYHRTRIMSMRLAAAEVYERSIRITTQVRQKNMSMRSNEIFEQ